jgi:hypothetical protein
MLDKTAEHARLRDAREESVPWRKWGPYLSERQWGTVREDYSSDGNAWSHFSHDQARSRAYLWGEDGIGGLSDEEMRLCFALALWNERDPILKERMFGLTNSEGNHGEDVKEYYYYLDSTPTHSYMKMLYKYPQRDFPYADLVNTNGARSTFEPEYELLDTGVFDEDRYFDVFVEYAKADPEDILIRITAINRGPEPAPIRIVPHLWFRNTWWQSDGMRIAECELRNANSGGGKAEGSFQAITATHPELETRYLYCEGAPELLFTNNETNLERILGRENTLPYVKDGINDYIVHGRRDAINPAQEGTKSAAHYSLVVAPGDSAVVRLRLTAVTGGEGNADSPFHNFDSVFAERLREADDFYAALTPPSTSDDAAAVMRQGYAGMLWSKQTYVYDLYRWLKERNVDVSTGRNSHVRNSQWSHMHNVDVISMPDKWEYPWFAAWDLAFHAIALAVVDPDFALDQLELMMGERYLHPNGQIPAYEWNFGDVNPPVHAWATNFNYQLNGEVLGDRALEHLRHSFHKLLVNFTWWVNRKDRNGRNVFEGGFLGLDNIGVFDRSSPLPTGGHLEQADGTAWMALFAQNMLEIAIELAMHDPVYEELAVKFYQHYIWIASAMDRLGEASDEMWDEEDGFFYDVLRLPDGTSMRLKVRSMVGLLPLCAATVYPEESLKRMPSFAQRVGWFNRQYPELLAALDPPGRRGVKGRRLLSLLNEEKLRRVLSRMLDPEEFLSDYGIRALSRYHLEHPYIFNIGPTEYRVSYLPAESDSGMFGGNSNWRGPIWMPVNVLIIRALLQLYTFYGNDFKVECPVGSGRMMTLYEVSHEIANRLIGIFTRGADGRRAVFGGAEKMQTDPHWRDNILFYEYFHGDNGAGIGASHQTGWTGLVATLITFFGTRTAEEILDGTTLAKVISAMK